MYHFPTKRKIQDQTYSHFPHHFVQNTLISSCSGLRQVTEVGNSLARGIRWEVARTRHELENIDPIAGIQCHTYRQCCVACRDAQLVISNPNLPTLNFSKTPSPHFCLQNSSQRQVHGLLMSPFLFGNISTKNSVQLLDGDRERIWIASLGSSSHSLSTCYFTPTWCHTGTRSFTLSY